MYAKNITADDHPVETVGWGRGVNREATKGFIRLADSFEEIDKLLEERAGLHTWQEKLAYLYGMFDVRIFCDADGTEDDYRAVVAGIIRMKYG